MQIFQNPQLHDLMGLSNLSHVGELLLVKENPTLRNARGLGNSMRASKPTFDVDVYPETLGKINKVNCLALDCLMAHQAIGTEEEKQVEQNYHREL